MALRTSVIVREVKNLSDARYCAGMGVDMVGFCIDKNNQAYIEPEKVKEIAGWLAGIKLVAEVNDLSAENISLIADLDPEIVIAPEADSINYPLLLKVNFDPADVEEAESYFTSIQQRISGFVLENDSIEDCMSYKEVLVRWCEKYPVYLGFGISQSNVDDILEEIKPAGICLKGGDEIRPGLKNFDELAEILENLEILD